MYEMGEHPQRDNMHVNTMGDSLVDQYPITLVHIVGFKIIENRTNILQVLWG